MSVSIDATNFNEIDPLDADNVTTFGGWSMEGVEIVSHIQGTGCIEARWNGVPALSGMLHDVGANQDWTDRVLYMWGRPSFPVDTFANGGIRQRFGGATDYGEWDTGGSNVGIFDPLGWYRTVVDCMRPYDRVGGTIPEFTAEDEITLIMVPVAGSGKDAAVGDQYAYMNGPIIIEGGTTGARGTFAEVDTAERTAGRGLIKLIGSAYFINTNIEWGDSGAGTSYFEDELQVVIFEDLPVDAAWYVNNFVANGTGTNHFQLGSTSGSGAAQEGVGGGVWQAAGAIPFHVHAYDVNSDAVNFYGVTFTNAPALVDDALRSFVREDNGTSFTHDTYDANSDPAVGATTVAPFPTGSGVNDACYFGHNQRFEALNIDVQTAGIGTYTMSWEYSAGSSTWTALTDVTDGTTDLQTVGINTVTYAIPDDWVTDAVDSQTRYWIRGIRDGGTVTTDPVLDQAQARMGGGARFEDPNVDVVRCVFTNMDVIRIRNDAIFRKNIVSDSVTGTKSAAIDLGDTDPATDSFRDITVQNCTRGILLKGTSTGTTTYNFRNIQFSGNTSDVRVDFPGAATVVINRLETTPTMTIQNVNSSTVTQPETVTVATTCLDQSGNPIEGVAVRVEQDPSGTLISQGNTNASGLYSFSYTDTTPQAVLVKARLKGYVQNSAFDTIVATDGLGVAFTMVADRVVNLP